MKKMTPRVKLLKELVNDELYVIDEAAVADAVMLRSMTRRVLPEVTFRGTPRPAPGVRSFRPHRGVKSFKLTRAQRRPAHGGGAAVNVMA
jgi:hypothetical protein